MSDGGVLTEIQAEERLAELLAANVRLERQVARYKERSDRMSEAMYEATKDFWLTAPTVQIPKPLSRKSSRRPEVALWHLTDFQGSKVTSTYNSEVMRERVHRFVAKAIDLTEKQTAPVKDCVILFGGDMVEGLFNYPAQLHEIDKTLHDQWGFVSQVLAEVVAGALAAYEKVTVVSEWGNHGRIGSKRADVPKWDNIDRMCYNTARLILANEKRLTWEDCPEDIQRVEIGNYRALLIHGDEVGRNGFASPMTIVRHADRWRSGAYRHDGEPWDFRDLYIGHYHTHAEWPMANGEGTVYQTGSTESDNRYARDLLASTARPSQRLHFIDPVKGRVSAQYKVFLDDKE